MDFFRRSGMVLATTPKEVMALVSLSNEVGGAISLLREEAPDADGDSDTTQPPAF